MNATTYYPEMNETKPEAEFEATVTFGGKWRVKTTKELSGQGITFEGVSNVRPGIKIYTMTKAAFKKVAGESKVAVECLL